MKTLVILGLLVGTTVMAATWVGTMCPDAGGGCARLVVTAKLSKHRRDAVGRFTCRGAACPTKRGRAVLKFDAPYGVMVFGNRDAGCQVGGYADDFLNITPGVYDCADGSSGTLDLLRR